MYFSAKSVDKENDNNDQPDTSSKQVGPGIITKGDLQLEEGGNYCFLFVEYVLYLFIINIFVYFQISSLVMMMMMTLLVRNSLMLHCAHTRKQSKSFCSNNYLNSNYLVVLGKQYFINFIYFVGQMSVRSWLAREK